MRFAFAVGLVAAFALGSVGAFLALNWPPLLREMVFGYLLVFLVIRVAVVSVACREAWANASPYAEAAAP